MELTYDHKRVQKLFDDFDQMRKETNTVFTKLVKKRVDQLRAFETFADYLQSGLGKPHPLSGNKKDCYGIHITGGTRLVVCPLSLDLSTESLQYCKKILIKGVENYHGSKTTSYIP
ncbi:MAG: hypothetical protein K9K93_01715 [Acholeplasmataceae bacterium]|nr:hypothetical protein [Acholeplasmataceae bacterium]